MRESICQKIKHQSKIIMDMKYAREYIVCDCGHYAKNHYNTEGWCDKCGCTWYWPNYKWLIRQKAKQGKLVQVFNPISKHWTIINKEEGKIEGHTKTSKPWKNIQIIERCSNVRS